MTPLVYENVVHKAAPRDTDVGPDTDPVLVEVIRHGLNSAANQMKRALVRTAFSPVIYEVLDFAVAIYDPELRLLAQAPSLPLFMGTMNFCVEAAVRNVGGAETLRSGDIILYNEPYGTGSHPQDAAVVMPVFYDGALVAYTAIKGHWLDIGGKEPYSTDTVDVFQEGTIFPGVRLYSGGVRVDDIYRMALANSRVPKAVAGDINAEVVGVRTGASAVTALVGRYGLERFRAAVSRMYDHGEAVVRSYFEALPDGVFVGHGEMDNNGITDDRIPFDVTMTINGTDVTLDFSEVPEAQVGPVNCPVPSTMSASRIAIAMLAGNGEAPNEGHFRPVTVITRPGSMFHPISPSPCFLYGWPAMQAIEAIYQAVARALPTAVTACSGGDICSLVWWGVREETGEAWADGSPHPVGQGAHANGDGANSLLHISESATRFAPVEVWETKNPWLLERVELIQDSGGPGRYRGGLGVEMDFQMLEDCWVTTVVERTKNPAWGLEGGLPAARANSCALTLPDGSRSVFGKATRLLCPTGSTLELTCGGGGGFGPPADRPAEEVHADIAEGYVSGEAARTDYSHAFTDAES
jgi:N-methylhydantoinase B